MYEYFIQYGKCYNVFSKRMSYCSDVVECPTVLVFDSGVGGLSVYEELRLLYPNVRYLYFFDNEVFPYGERTNLYILDRVVSILVEISRRYRLDLVVIACNTVTVLLLEKLRSYFFFPIIGVVPDIRSGIYCTRNGIIGLLGTYKTVSSNFISNVINQFSVNYRFLLLNASELVCVAEDKVLHGKKVSIVLLQEILTPWLNVLQQPDTIILGCTHFLHLKNELSVFFSKKVCLIGLSRNLVYRIVYFLKSRGIFTRNFDLFKIKNQMYCSVITEQILLIWESVLLRYNFCSLRKISI